MAKLNKLFDISGLSFTSGYTSLHEADNNYFRFSVYVGGSKDIFMGCIFGILKYINSYEDNLIDSFDRTVIIVINIKNIDIIEEYLNDYRVINAL